MKCKGTTKSTEKRKMLMKLLNPINSDGKIFDTNSEGYIIFVA